MASPLLINKSQTEREGSERKERVNRGRERVTEMATEISAYFFVACIIEMQWGAAAWLRQRNQRTLSLPLLVSLSFYLSLAHTFMQVVGQTNGKIKANQGVSECKKRK